MILLILAQLLLAVTLGPGALGRSLTMNAAGFSKFDITLTAAIQGVISLGLVLVLGWLSDRIGRRWILIGSFALITASLVLVAISKLLWQFYAFAALFSFLTVASSVGPAYVVDISPPGGVGRGVSLFQSMFWIGCVAGMASAGYAFDRLGTFTPIAAASLFPIAAAVLLLFIRVKTPLKAALPPLR